MSIVSNEDLKNIKALAARLPVVHEQTYSGFKMVNGRPVKNVVSHPVNHERRIRRAYERDGMTGVMAYIKKVQKVCDEHSKRIMEQRKQQEQWKGKPSTKRWLLSRLSSLRSFIATWVKRKRQSFSSYTSSRS